MTLCTPAHLRELADNDFERAGQSIRDALRDAADEIERLEGEISTTMTMRLQAENDKLRAERDQYLKSSVDYGNECERLRAELKAAPPPPDSDNWGSM